MKKTVLLISSILLITLSSLKTSEMAPSKLYASLTKYLQTSEKEFDKIPAVLSLLHWRVFLVG